jgi:hypothetical protein
MYVEAKFYALSPLFTYVQFSNVQYDLLQVSRISWSPRVAALEEYCHSSKNTTFQEREKNPNFSLISLNCEEVIAITIAIFGYKEVYNVP